MKTKEEWKYISGNNTSTEFIRQIQDDAIAHGRELERLELRKIIEDELSKSYLELAKHQLLSAINK